MWLSEEGLVLFVPRTHRPFGKGLTFSNWLLTQGIESMLAGQKAPNQNNQVRPARDVTARRAKYAPAGTVDEFIVPLLKDRIEGVLRNGLPPVPRSVADVGCGRQPFRGLLEGKDSFYVGIDVVQTPEQSVDFVATIDGSLPEELLAAGPFDFLLCTEVLEHVADWGTAFANIAALLRAGGRALVTCPHFYMLHEEPYDFWRPTLHAVSHYARINGLAVVREEKVGDGWDVIGTLLASCAATPHRPGIRFRIGSKIVNAARRMLFALLKWRLPQRLARLPGTYLCNVVLLEKK
jgi:SAM-dependent methyltransferase